MTNSELLKTIEDSRRRFYEFYRFDELREASRTLYELCLKRFELDKQLQVLVDTEHKPV